ncbi:MAG: ATP-binding protein [Gammaproteobacteria bacterium]|nr:ATP-binding protein [Gammaproteobacteria bacterium]
MNDDQKRELESYLELTEGDPPPVFVGRAEVLDDIARATKQVWKGTGSDKHGAAKTTRIIQGAPGAGKSSIVNEIRQNSKRLYTEIVGKAPMVVALDSGKIHGPANILKPLAEKINPLKAQEFMARITKNTSGEAGFGLGLFRFARKKETGIEHQAPDANWDTFGAWVEQYGGFDRPIVLAIDEAQRLDYDRQHPLAKLLQSLHDGCGLPIALVLAGLSDTEYSARKMDLNRIPPIQKHNIGCFPDCETREFMAISCVHFGIDVAGYEDEIYRLAEPCDGWPRHLNIVLKAFAREALRTGGDLGKAEWEGIRDEIKSGTDGYYGHQYSDEMEISINLTARVMAELDFCHSRAKIQDLMEELHEADPRKYRLPAGIDADSFFIHLVHQGALHKESVDRFVCPIPSFRTYLLDRGGILENPTRISGAVSSNDSSSPD